MSLGSILKRVLGFLGRATLMLIVVVTITAVVTVYWFRHRGEPLNTVSAEVALPRAHGVIPEGP